MTKPAVSSTGRNAGEGDQGRPSALRGHAGAAETDALLAARQTG